MIETIRRAIETGLVSALIVVVAIGISIVFGKQKLGNYKMSDFDDENQEKKSKRKIANLK